MTPANQKIKVATCSLAGCFGCHMSFLDIDERITTLIDYVRFDRSPLTDIKKVGHCAVGLVEGGLCNTENVEVLKEFREHCDLLVSVGACAINGGVPAMRNNIPLEECLKTAYIDGVGVVDPQIPQHEDIPALLNQVLPIHEAVHIDYFLPGCPPPADAFWELLTALIENREPNLDYAVRHFD
ncbi:MAG: NADP oxidoreductase [Pseudomonadales bacterium]|nr:NADP oxidoreductase [Pseudomonadales bacterium]